jgi:hypothetical protein
VGKARAGAGLREMRWGSECGRRRGSKRGWGRGRASWPRIPATCARWSTEGVGRAELTGEAHGAEREDGRAGATAWCLVERAHEAEREEGHAGEETGADSLAPLGRERGREGARRGRNCR